MIRLALIGCGRVAEAFHLPAIARVDGVVLSAVVDVDQSRARSLASMSGVKGVVVAREVADVFGACDAALIALPNYLHAPVCVPLLERAHHVLVEKPMASTVDDCDQLISTARASGAVLSVAMVRRFIAAYELVNELITQRTFGAVRRVRVREGVVYNWPATTGFFLKKEQAGGGVLVDFGSHVLDALVWWLGDLTVESYEDDACGGVEAECRIKLSSAQGVAIDIELSRLRRLSCTARVECERAAVEINMHSGAADLFVVGTRTPLRGRVGVLDRGGWAAAADPFTLQLQAFVTDIHRQAGVTSTAATARSVATLFEACASRRQPLVGPASPVVDLATLAGTR
jgi:predicted dehydrogenase